MIERQWRAVPLFVDRERRLIIIGSLYILDLLLRILFRLGRSIDTGGIYNISFKTANSPVVRRRFKKYNDDFRQSS